MFTWGSILMWFIMFALLCSSTAFVMSPENFTYFDAVSFEIILKNVELRLLDFHFKLLLNVLSPYLYYSERPQIYRVLQARTWWLTLFLTSVVCIFPYMGYKLYIILTKPSLLQEVMVSYYQRLKPIKLNNLGIGLLVTQWNAV